MRFEAIPINKHEIYNLFIETEDKPDSELRELIRAQIDKAMSSFERRDPQTHRIAIIPDWDSAESGSPEIPESLDSRNQYLIFAIVYSPEPDSAESLSHAELEYYREELGSMLEGISGEETRAALVLLRDCSVSVIEADKSGSWYSWGAPNVIEPRDIFPDSPWNSDRDTPEKRWG